MLKFSIHFWMVAILLAGCAHRGAARVECEGPLRPINASATLRDAPVTVVPASPDTPKASEGRP
jgi:hypothetical protein